MKMIDGTSFLSFDSGLGSSNSSPLFAQDSLGDQFDYDLNAAFDLEHGLDPCGQSTWKNPVFGSCADFFDLESGSSINYVPSPPPEEPITKTVLNCAQPVTRAASPAPQTVINVRLVPSPYGPSQLFPRTGPSKEGAFPDQLLTNSTTAAVSSTSLPVAPFATPEDWCRVSIPTVSSIGPTRCAFDSQTATPKWILGNFRKSLAKCLKNDSIDDRRLRFAEVLADLAVSSSDESSQSDDDMEEGSEQSSRVQQTKSMSAEPGSESSVSVSRQPPPRPVFPATLQPKKLVSKPPLQRAVRSRAKPRPNRTSHVDRPRNRRRCRSSSSESGGEVIPIPKNRREVSRGWKADLPSSSLRNTRIRAEAIATGRDKAVDHEKSHVEQPSVPQLPPPTSGLKISRKLERTLQNTATACAGRVSSSVSVIRPASTSPTEIARGRGRPPKNPAAAARKRALEAVRNLMALRCGLLVNGSAPPPEILDWSKMQWESTAPVKPAECIMEPTPKKPKLSTLTPDASIDLVYALIHDGSRRKGPFSALDPSPSSSSSL